MSENGSSTSTRNKKQSARERQRARERQNATRARFEYREVGVSQNINYELQSLDADGWEVLGYTASDDVSGSRPGMKISGKTVLLRRPNPKFKARA